jgi:hypothetical protein
MSEFSARLVSSRGLFPLVLMASLLPLPRLYRFTFTDNSPLGQHLVAFSNGSLNEFSSSTPTAAHEPDQPTTLSSPLARPSLTLPVRYPLAHTSDTTSTSPA